MANKINNIELAEFAETSSAAHIWGADWQNHHRGSYSRWPPVSQSVYRGIQSQGANMGKSYDCVGLIKCAMWGNKGDGLLRIYDASTDITANDMLDNRAGSISAMPEIQLMSSARSYGIYIGGVRLSRPRRITAWEPSLPDEAGKSGASAMGDYVTQTDFACGDLSVV